MTLSPMSRSHACQTSYKTQPCVRFAATAAWKVESQPSLDAPLSAVGAVQVVASLVASQLDVGMAVAGSLVKAHSTAPTPETLVLEAPKTHS